jgi:hypothetical protein
MRLSQCTWNPQNAEPKKLIIARKVRFISRKDMRLNNVKAAPSLMKREKKGND